jgi:predicted metal-dependent peptidase
MNEAAQRMSRARLHLLLDHPFFGTLALRLQMEEGRVETMGTNGTKLVYNPEYVMSLTDDQLVGVNGHEVMHCAMGHMYRGKGREWHRWNMACDLAINPLLREAGLSLPYTELEKLEHKYLGMSAEEIYAKLEEEGKGGQGQQGKGRGKGKPQPKEQSQNDGEGQGGGPPENFSQPGWPDFSPAPIDSNQAVEEGEDRMTEADWQIAAEQAAMAARRAGTMGANLDRALEASREAKTDWRTILRRFIENSMPSDYSWSNPNRRYIHQGIYLPGVVKENMPRIGVAVDTSGSIDQVMLTRFAEELTAIMKETRPESIDVVYCDTSVKGQESFDPDDDLIVLHARGGGGTAFQPALDHFTIDPPVCVIYLTDLMGPFPQEPEYPVLWAVPEQYTTPEPFGERVALSRFE